MNNDAEPLVEDWWGHSHVALDETIERQIGTLNVQVTRRSYEWLVTTTREETGRNTQGPVANRYAYSETSGRLNVTPALADRPVVARPLTPIEILSGAAAIIYISSPVFVRIEVNEPPVVLEECFAIQPSDTWFGKTTIDGELCYASRTHARLSHAEIPLRPERALTSVRIANRGLTPLLLERIAIPAPHLTLFATKTGILWTQDVSFVRETDSELVDLSFGPGAPRAAKDASQIADARLPRSANSLFRAFGAMLT